MPQRARDAGQDAGGPHVRVLVERLADGEPQTPKRDVVGNVGRADRAEVDGVELAELIGAALRHHDAVFLVVVRSPVEVLDVELEAAVALGANFQGLQPRRDHLRPDAVAAHGRNPMCSHVSVLSDKMLRLFVVVRSQAEPTVDPGMT